MMPVTAVDCRTSAGGAVMAKLQSELTVDCPCCKSTLVIDLNLKRVVEHREPERSDKPSLDHAQRILAEQQARREALFEQSKEDERTRGDALSKRFEEALRQAREEPITKPKRDFDWD
jgi:GTP cyclohydrolase FolE2